MSTSPRPGPLVRREYPPGPLGPLLLVASIPLIALSAVLTSVDGVAQVALPAVAAASTALAGMRRALGRRTPWLLLSAAQACNAAGNATFTGAGAPWRTDILFGAPLVGATEQVLFLLATGLSVLAVVHLAQPPDLTRLTRALVEGLLMACAVFTVAWTYGLGAALAGPDVRELVAAVGLLELVLNFLTVGVLVAVWSGRFRPVRPGTGAGIPGSTTGVPGGVPVLLAAGLGASVLADVAFVLPDLLGLPGPVPAVSALWLVSSVAVGASPWYGPLLAGHPGADPPVVSPFTFVVCAAASLALIVAGPRVVDAWVVTGAGLAMLLVTVLLWSRARAVRRLADEVADRERQVRARGNDRHDGLTGLPNRLGLETELAQALERSGDVGLLYVDVDGFKDINDSAGYAAGDAVITQVAQRMRLAVGERGVVCRFGGAEFAVLVTEDVRVPALTLLAGDVVASLDDAFEADGGLHHLAACVGLATREPGRPAAELIRNADLAMHRAKTEGWGVVKAYTPGMHAAVVDRVQTRSRLRSAVQTATPELRFQPQVRLSDGAVVGVEALVGWLSAEGERLSTAAVIELAEDSGAIVDLGTRVLRAASHQGAHWRAGGLDLRMSVNLSVRQLEWPGIVEVLDATLAESGFPAAGLTLEVTETLLVSRSVEALRTLEGLRGTGVRLAVDDFGTGYSGLDYLRRLTVDEMKVDRSFLERAGRQARATALLQGIVRLGRDLGLQIVGEGVEDVDQARLLRRIGCHVGQGFAFSRPLAAAEVEDFVALGPFDLEARSGPVALGQAGTVPRRRRPGQGPASVGAG